MMVVLYLKTKRPHALLVCFDETCAVFFSLFNYAAVKTIKCHSCTVSCLNAQDWLT